MASKKDSSKKTSAKKTAAKSVAKKQAVQAPVDKAEETPVEKAEVVKVKKAPAAKVNDSILVDSYDAVRAVEAALKSNAQHCALLVPDVDESDVREVLIARVRYGKINLSDL